MGYIPQRSLENLKKYSYKGVDKSVSVLTRDILYSHPPLWPYRSLISRYVLNPFWTWFVTLWPLSVAPNTVSHRTRFFVGPISVRELILLLIDHSDWVSHRFLQLFHDALLWSHVSYGKGGCGRSSTLAIFHVCCSIFFAILSQTLIVIQMGDRLVSVSKLGCYRWVHIISSNLISSSISRVW